MGYALLYSTLPEHAVLPWFILRGCAIVARFQTESEALMYIAATTRAPRHDIHAANKICLN